MTISFTWPNVYKLAAFVGVILAIIISFGSFVIQRQIDHINSRMDDRLSMYQSNLTELQRRIERLENR